MSSEKLKNLGLKITVPRLKIYQLFHEPGLKHLSAYEIQETFSQSDTKINLATIYRVLNQFEELGIITRHDFDDDRAVYELTDSNHHDHIVCNSCGKVIEFFDEIIENRQIEIAKKHNFNMLDHCMIMYGVCESCNH